MKITFVLPYAGLQGGVRVVAIYADHLHRRGHHVHIVSVPQTYSSRQIAKSLLLDRCLPRPQPSFFEGLAVQHRVLESVRPVTDADVPDADVVIATYYTTAGGVLGLSPSKGAKAIFIQNYEVPEGQSNPALDATWRMPMHKIVISKWLVAFSRERFGDVDVSHVPNGVDLVQFNAPPRNKSVRPTVGLLYNTNPMKGCDVSFAALRSVAAKLPGLRLVCFGAEKPSYRVPLPRFAEFHFQPAQQSLRDLYAQCDVWLCGSHVEGFHLPPIEAMACRCPVVSTRVGGPLDTIEEGINGHLVELKDSLALADRTLRVLTLPNASWVAMSQAAYQTAMAFSWDDATDLFEDALRHAIAKPFAACQRTPVGLAKET
jgi:glycosyltransferase involved in cell wall biosynthesis